MCGNAVDVCQKFFCKSPCPTDWQGLFRHLFPLRHGHTPGQAFTVNAGKEAEAAEYGAIDPLISDHSENDLLSNFAAESSSAFPPSGFEFI